VDVIVNSANRMLFRGSGICGAIHKAAGIELQKECIEIQQKNFPKGLRIGEVAVTKAYNLPSNWVFHTLGPRHGADDINLLQNCYINCINLADSLGAKSISFPAISTNIYGVPIEFSAKTVKDVLDNLHEMKSLEEINLVFFKEENHKVYSVVFQTEKELKR